MFRKILLIICIAFVVVCYGYPCFILPLGTYSYTTTVLEQEVTTTYKFGFNGKVTVGSSATDTTTEYFYKLSGNKVIISEDETFDDNDIKLAINNMYQINMPTVLSITDTEANVATNQVGMWVTIGIGVLALLLVITIPRRS